MVDTLLNVLWFLGIFFVGILIWAALSPFETMGWWAGWFGDTIYEEPVPSDGLLRRVHHDTTSYVLFLSGVGRTSSETLSHRERVFLEHLAHVAAKTVIIDDVFPYSVNNLSLTAQPIFARFWRRALQWKQHGPRFAGNLINLRNIFQILISIDKRYGPMYNQGVAEVLFHGLLRYDYRPECEMPVFLVASSGAAQIAVGAAPYLKELVNAPVYVVSVGGVFGSDPGLLDIDHIYHLYGSKDAAVRWSNLDAGRWPISASSTWNRAKRQGKVSEVCLGAMCHSGRGSYLDFRAKTATGQPYVEKTAQTVSAVIDKAIALRTSLEPSTVGGEITEAQI